MMHGIGLLLVSAVAGYWVIERAEAHKGQLRQLGRIVGSAVIIISLGLTIYKVLVMATGDCQKGAMGKGMCPFSGKPDMSMPAK